MANLKVNFDTVEFINNSTKFFDNQINNVSQGFEQNQHYPQYSATGPSVICNGTTYHWKLDFVATQNTQVAVTNVISESESEPEDIGWESITKMLKEPEFKQNFEEFDHE